MTEGRFQGGKGGQARRASLGKGDSKGGKKASERRRGIGEDERQPVMARLAAPWRRSNLVILVTLKKGNHPGEA